VSLLAIESIDKMKQLGLAVGPGDFAENITTSGLDLPHIPVGTVLETDGGLVLEVTRSARPAIRNVPFSGRLGNVLCLRKEYL